MKSQEELPQLLSLKYVCKRLQLHPNTLRLWEKKGLLVPVRIGLRGDRRYRKTDIERLLTPKKFNQQNTEFEQQAAAKKTKEEWEILSQQYS